MKGSGQFKENWFFGLEILPTLFQVFSTACTQTLIKVYYFTLLLFIS